MESRVQEFFGMLFTYQLLHLLLKNPTRVFNLETVNLLMPQHRKNKYTSAKSRNFRTVEN